MIDVKEQTVGSIIKRIVGNAQFSFYRQSILYYRVLLRVDDNFESDAPILTFSFPIPASDLDGATVNKSEKPITLMRYIRKALEDGTFVRSL